MSERRRLPIPLLIGSLVFSVAVGLLAAWLIVGPSSDDSTIGADRFVSGSSDAQVAVTGTAKVGAPAPKAAFTYMEGTTGALSDYRGTPMVLNFWGSTCAPCLREMPALQKLSDQLGDQAIFLGVDVGDNLHDGEKMVQQTGVRYPQARDPKSALIAAFGGTGLPHTVLIDKTGKVVEIHTGVLDDADLAAIPHQLGVG